MITKAKEILAGAKDKMAHATSHLDEELKTYRAGKANPLVFNTVMVDYYGCPTPLPQVASVTTPDAKTLMLQPWEKKMIPVIEKAIIDANLGFTPSNNGESIRCTVPPLTEDRLKVMDQTAFALCREGNMPIIVFDMNQKGNLTKLVKGEKVGTLVHV